MNKTFNLKKMLNIYNKMFKGKYDESIFYQIVHYYNGKIVDKNELENYFDVLNDNSFQLRPSYINDETIYKTKQLLNVLRFLSIQDDDIINNFDCCFFEDSYFYFQKYTILDNNEEKRIYENYFFIIQTHQINSDTRILFNTSFFAESDGYNVKTPQTPIFFSIEEDNNKFILKYSDNTVLHTSGCNRFYKKLLKNTLSKN